MILASAFLNQIVSPQFEVKPVYLIYGEEPLFLRDCSDALRQKLVQYGYIGSDVYEVDAGFDWRALQMETASGSLFSEQRYLQLNMPKGNPGKEGSDFICSWGEYETGPVPETVLIVQCERLDSKQLKAKWVAAIEAKGLVVQAKPVPIAALPKWCQDRGASLGLQLDSEAAALLAQRTEGNLLAADQELQKIALLSPPSGQISVDFVAQTVVDQAHYQLFALAGSVLNGQLNESLQILQRLRQEGIEAAIILWLLSKELRQLVELTQLCRQIALPQAFKQCRIWSSRQGEYRAAVGRGDLGHWQKLLGSALQADLRIKGIQPILHDQEIWSTLDDLVVAMAS
ncbi:MULTISPECIES: DNA polymerase III subunit delta [Thiomicrorhabdus]|uniref:DNA polymerase III subunit delta n=1 Tax=Thiomicrorhabdus heinhorstiae TaxID=2748010 RepID=A0ABS0BXU4_9GAMM|nr:MULTISPECIES: DNA polymerase III subunit delta [Thiomicrorhabdus]MBF6058605.1 DNA polymerase III subunit delta [Thiomicrorhabdus heinhorstiae]